MSRFGGNEFTASLSVPLVFDGRYFILEPGDPPLISVVLDVNGKPVFEVLKNRPVDNGITDVSQTSAGITTVSKGQGGKFLYKVRPGSESSVVFGKLDGGEIEAKISDRFIRVGGVHLQNNAFHGVAAGIVVNRDGTIRTGAPVPEFLRKLLFPE